MGHVRHEWSWRALAVTVTAVTAVATGCSVEDGGRPERASSSGDRAARGEAGADAAERSAEPQPRTRPGTPRRTAPPPAPSPTATPRPRPTFLVARVIDGDTLELGNGDGVRLVGIDTPERGECGFDEATANLVRLVEGRNVTLTMSDEDTDRYGRLLRYVNIGTTDAGLRLIKNGRAVARYDSRDGYGFHRREPAYIAADRDTPRARCARAAPTPSTPAPAAPAGDCAAGYSPCVPVYPPDVDCPDVDGPVSVSGTDPHALDADGDGVACE
ncbi:hypothetical protein GCM10009562_02590 [Nocardioides aquaticus]